MFLILNSHTCRFDIDLLYISKILIICLHYLRTKSFIMKFEIEIEIKLLLTDLIIVEVQFKVCECHLLVHEEMIWFWGQ
jgi:hypothetical protein